MRQILIAAAVFLAGGTAGVLLGQAQDGSPSQEHGGVTAEDIQWASALEAMSPAEQAAAIKQRDAAKPRVQLSPEEEREARIAKINAAAEFYEQQTAALTGEQLDAVLAVTSIEKQNAAREISQPLERRINSLDSELSEVQRALQDLRDEVKTLKAKLAE
jgi:wobble nucleotide-excising tRNase